MDEVTAFDLAFRGELTDDLSEIFQHALDQGCVLTASQNSPAPQIAKHAATLGAEVICVVDQARSPVGYIFPGWVTKQVTTNRAPVATLVEAVDLLVAEAKQPGRLHLHEWLNFDRPEARTCPGKGKPHKTFFDPCLITAHN